MAGKDVTEKLLLQYPDVFAAVANRAIYDGEAAIDPASLRPAVTVSGYRDGSTGHTRNLDRDVAMYWEDAGITIAALGVENQSRPDRYMAARTLAYDAARYREQLVSGFTGLLYPVVTIVLYYGAEPWGWPGNLLSAVDTSNERLRPFLNDYRINLVWVPDWAEDRDKLPGDFWYVADCARQLRDAPEKAYELPEDGMIEHIETLDCLAELTGSPVFADAARSPMLRAQAEKGAIPMQTTLDIMAEEQREQGREQGRLEGREQGRLEGREQGLFEGLVRAYADMGMSPEGIAVKTGKPVEEVNDILRKL